MRTDREKAPRDWRMPDAWGARLSRVLPPTEAAPIGVPSTPR
jgi:hypothetical protein